MRTTVQLKGAPDYILEKAVELGVARSKTDALRMGVFALNKEYNLVKDIEMEMVAKKIEEQEAEMKRKGLDYIDEETALAKYRKR